jgi:hypothetical protein
MDIRDAIRDFGSLANLPGFALDERGMARLQLDSTLIIDFEYDANQSVLHLYSSIAPAPAVDGEAQLRLLLEANLFLDRSVGTAFALDGSTGEFMACARLELEYLDAPALVKQVERMAAAVEKMREDLKVLAQATSESGKSGISPFFGGALQG